MDVEASQPCPNDQDFRQMEPCASSGLGIGPACDCYVSADVERWSQEARSKLAKPRDGLDAEISKGRHTGTGIVERSHRCGGWSWIGCLTAWPQNAALCSSWTWSVVSLCRRVAALAPRASFQRCSSWWERACPAGSAVHRVWAHVPNIVAPKQSKAADDDEVYWYS